MFGSYHLPCHPLCCHSAGPTLAGAGSLATLAASPRLSSSEQGAGHMASVHQVVLGGTDYGVPFDGSFLLRERFLSHLVLTKARLALCVDKTWGPGLPSWRYSYLESAILMPRQRATIAQVSTLTPVRQKGRGRCINMRTHSCISL